MDADPDGATFSTRATTQASRERIYITLTQSRCRGEAAAFAPGASTFAKAPADKSASLKPRILKPDSPAHYALVQRLHRLPGRFHGALQPGGTCADGGAAHINPVVGL